ncbi:glycosyltransferase [Candidatus Woesearchaeota archaeon]|nr:glycosyltransferase [Candidatus Woesearchaeota archaeon]
MNYQDTTIIIPTFNEEKNIAQLIDKIKKLLPKAKIIVSDDGSLDKTQVTVKKAAKKWAKGSKEEKGEKEESVILLDRTKTLVHGLTVSVIDAINLCKTSYFVVIDADFQHPPEKIKEVVNKLRASVEIVVGNRIKVSEDWSVSRIIISKTAYMLGYLRLLLKKFPKYDIVSGFFGGRTELAKQVIAQNYSKFELKGYKVLFDILKYLPSNAKIDKVDYEFGIRKAGQSKLNKKVMFYYLRSLFK